MDRTPRARAAAGDRLARDVSGCRDEGGRRRRVTSVAGSRRARRATSIARPGWMGNGEPWNVCYGIVMGACHQLDCYVVRLCVKRNKPPLTLDLN